MFYAFRLPAFKKLSQKIQEMPEFGAWLQQGTPEQCVPQLWEEEKQLSPIGSAMYQLLIIQVLTCTPFTTPGRVEKL
jgi:dynein heavy chain 1